MLNIGLYFIDFNFVVRLDKFRNFLWLLFERVEKLLMCCLSDSLIVFVLLYLWFRCFYILLIVFFGFCEFVVCIFLVVILDFGLR